MIAVSHQPSAISKTFAIVGAKNSLQDRCIAERVGVHERGLRFREGGFALLFLTADG